MAVERLNHLFIKTTNGVARWIAVAGCCLQQMTSRPSVVASNNVFPSVLALNEVFLSFDALCLLRI
jgi:hypothetical protein